MSSVWERLRKWREKHKRIAGVDRVIESYFWHVRQYNEWDQRFIADTPYNEALQEDQMEFHKERARDAFDTVTKVQVRGQYKLSPNQNIALEDGSVVYINCPNAEWDRLFMRGKQAICTTRECRHCNLVR